MPALGRSKGGRRGRGPCFKLLQCPRQPIAALQLPLLYFREVHCSNINDIINAIKMHGGRRLVFVSSVRSSSGYHGLIEIRSAAAAATFSNFSNSSDSKVKVKVKGPNMCYIFEKHGIQGYQI